MSLTHTVHLIQIGDNTEIMYFVAKTMKEMEEWLSACRHGKQVGRDCMD